jgi:ferritin
MLDVRAITIAEPILKKDVDLIMETIHAICTQVQDRDLRTLLTLMRNVNNAFDEIQDLINECIKRDKKVDTKVTAIKVNPLIFLI